MSCILPSLTDSTMDSLLAKDLNNVVSEEQIENEHLPYFSSTEFIDIFGDYHTAYHSETGIPVEFKGRVYPETGEPLLKFDKALKKYYFKDKYNEKQYYPYNQTGLQGVATTVERKELVEALALSFAKSVNLDFSVEGFSIEDNVEGLKNHIATQLDALQAKLEREEDDFDKMLKATTVEEVKKYIPELADNIVDHFKTKNIILKEDTLTEEEEAAYEEIETKGFGGRKASFLKPYKTNMLRNIKMFLSLIEDTRQNSFGMFTYVPYNDIYSTLFKILSNEVAVKNVTNENAYENLYDVYVQKIKEALKVKPYLQNLVDKLEDPKIATDTFKNQFVSAFYLFKNNFLGSEFAIDYNGKILYKVKNLSDVGSRQSNIMTTWWENLTKLESNQKLDNAIKEFQKFIQDFNLNRTQYAPDQIDDLIEKVGYNLEAIGITIQPEAFKYYLNNNTFEEVDFQDKLMNINTLLNDRIYKRILQPYEDGGKDRDSLFEMNPLKQQASELNKLTNAAAFFMEETTDASIFTLGKTKWAYSNPSFLDLKIAEWKKNPEALLEHYKSTPFNKRSYIMRWLLGMDKSNQYTFDPVKSKERLDKVEVGIFNSLQEEGNAINASENDTLSYTDALVDYIHKMLGVRGKTSPKSWFKTALAADKSTEYQINYGIDLVSAKVRVEGGEYTISDEALSIMMDYYLDEYNRMLRVSNDITQSFTDESVELIPNYHTNGRGGLKSQLFPELSPRFDKKGNLISSVDTKKEFGLSFYLFDDAGFPVVNNLENETAKLEEIKQKFIKPKLIQKIKNFNEVLLKENIISYNEKGILSNNSIDTSIFDYYTQDTNSNIAKGALEIAGDLIVNGIVSQVEYSKLFSGDLAYYKSMIDYKKRIPATYTDGLYMNIYKKEDMEFKISVVESVEIDAPSKKYLETYSDVANSYNNVDTTDAQAYITPKRWRFILNKLGKWTSAHDALWEEMQKQTPTYSEEQRKLLAQPLKGVYFDTHKGRPVFLKYSQAVLVPNLVRNAPTLRKILTKMQNQNISELVTSGGIKVGFIKPEKIHDEEGNLLEDFKLNEQILNNKFWKLQQDLPTKGIKLTDVGSQIQKNIFQALVYDLEAEFELDNGSILNGDQMINRLTDISNTMLYQNKAKVYTDLGIDPDTLEIKNEDLLYNKIIAQLEKRSDVSQNIIDGLRAGLSPYGIPGATELFQHVFSSIVNNELNKLKTNGGGFIQMADFGITKEEAESKKGIKFTPWFLASPDNRATMPKFETQPNGKEKLIPAGLFIPASLISQHIPDYTKYSPEQLFGRLNKKTGKYTGGMIDQEVLENIIGYRIPNQGLVSNDAFRVLGILPEGMGDTVVAYAGITRKTGSDFDIDKMYLMTPSVYTNQDGHIKYIHPKRAKGKELPIKDQSQDALRNMLIQSYKNILLQGSKKIMNKIVNPLDMDFLEMDINNLNAKEDPSAFDNFDAIEDLSTKIKFKSSKTGLGVAVNHTMDSVRGAMSSLGLSFYMGWGNFEKGVNTLDSEYSEELTDEEMDQYIKDYNGRITNPALKIGNPKNPKYPTKQSFKDKFKKVLLGDSFTALTNGFVDVANNPFIVEGNWVDKTNNVGFMMLRAGVHPFKINAFLNQPIIKDYIAFQNNLESKTVASEHNLFMSFKLKKAAEKIPVDSLPVTINGVTRTGREVFYSVINELKNIDARPVEGESEKQQFERMTKVYEQLESYKKTLSKKVGNAFKTEAIKITDPEDLAKIDKLTEQLLEHIEGILFTKPVKFEEVDFFKLRSQNRPDNIDFSVQEAMLNKFEFLNRRGRSLAKSVSASRTDVEGKGKDIASLITTINKILEAVKDPYITGFETKYYKGNRRSILGTHTDLSVREIAQIMLKNPKFFLPYREKSFNSFNILSRALENRGLVNDKLAHNILKSYNNYLLSGFNPFELKTEEYNDLVANITTILKNLQEKHPENPFLKELYLKEAGTITDTVDGETKVVGRTFQIGISNAKKSVTVINSMVDGFRDILDTDPIEADKLIKFAFISSGGTKTLNSFFEYIPYEWFNRNRFNQYLKDFVDIDNQAELNINFLHQFMRHNLTNTDLVPYSDIEKPSPYTRQGLPGQAYLDVVTTETMKKNNIPITVAFRTERVQNPDKNYFHPPYVGKGRPVQKAGPDGPYTEYHPMYFQLVGVKKGYGYYVRVNALGAKQEASGAKLTEYRLGNNFKSAFKENMNPPFARIYQDKIDKFLRENPENLDYSTGAFGKTAVGDDHAVTMEKLNDLTPPTISPNTTAAAKIGEAVNSPTKEKVENNLDNSEKNRTFVETIDRYSVEILRNNPDKIYIFGDNNQRRGKGGQAIIRDEENAFGISTKEEPSRNESAYMNDARLFEDPFAASNSEIIDSDIKKIKDDGRPIVFPKDGIGTGLAKLKEKAPKTYAYLKQRLLEEFGFDNDTGEIKKENKEKIEEPTFEENENKYTPENPFTIETYEGDKIEKTHLFQLPNGKYVQQTQEFVNLELPTKELTKELYDQRIWAFTKIKSFDNKAKKNKKNNNIEIHRDKPTMEFYDVLFTEEYKEDPSLPSLGAYSEQKGIRVRPNITKEEFFDHIEGKTDARGSRQKKIVFDRLINNFGYDIEEIKKLFETDADIKAFIIFHEISHLENKDTDSREKVMQKLSDNLVRHGYSEEEANDMLKDYEVHGFLPEVLDYETRATIDAFNSIKIAKDKFRRFHRDLERENDVKSVSEMSGFDLRVLYIPGEFKAFVGELEKTGQIGFDFSNNPCKK